ncbi:MAG: hypothetical protein AAGA42_11130 [Actinomycetota bacterium]
MTAPTDTAAPADPDGDADRAAEARGFFDPTILPPPSVTTAAPNLPSPSPVLSPAAPSHVVSSTPPSQVAATPPTTTFGALPALDALAPATGPATRGPSALRRGVSWVILLALLAGLVVAGVYFGPRLLELSKAETNDAPRLPLAYPVPIADPAPVRSAAFTVTRASTAGEEVRYDANIDFESGISQVVVEHPSRPTIEIRAVFDDAVIRRIDQPTWYRTSRGTFPFDGATAPTLVPTLDALLPLQTRGAVTILNATEETLGAVLADDADSTTEVSAAVANEPLQRLRLEIPQARLAILHDAPPVAAIEASDAAADPTPQPEPGTEPATVADAGNTPAPAPDPLAAPPLIVLPVGTPDQNELAGGEPVTVDVWVDDTGIIRHLRTDSALGSETLTVRSTSTEPWVPVFPEESAVQPLTADALLALGE